MIRLRAGQARVLVAAEFGSLGMSGIVVATLATARFVNHARSATDRGLAFTVAGVLIVVAGTAVIRALRARVVLYDDRLTVAGVTRTWKLDTAEVAHVGFGRTSLGLVLYLITHAGTPIFVWGVSGGRRLPAAENARATLAAAVNARHPMAVVDPVPELPDAAVEPTRQLPPCARTDAPSVGLFTRTLPGQFAVFGLMLFVAIGLQAALPWLFPWVLLIPVAVLLLLGLGPTALLARRYGRIMRAGTAAAGGGWVCLWSRAGWRSLNLHHLAGVGAVLSVHGVSIFSRAEVRRALRLVDTDGRRLDIDQLNLTSPILQEVRAFASEVPQTDLARQILASQANR